MGEKSPAEKRLIYLMTSAMTTPEGAESAIKMFKAELLDECPLKKRYPTERAAKEECEDGEIPRRCPHCASWHKQVLKIICECAHPISTYENEYCGKCGLRI